MLRGPIVVFLLLSFVLNFPTSQISLRIYLLTKTIDTTLIRLQRLEQLTIYKPKWKGGVWREIFSLCREGKLMRVQVLSVFYREA